MKDVCKSLFEYIEAQCVNTIMGGRISIYVEQCSRRLLQVVVCSCTRWDSYCHMDEVKSGSWYNNSVRSRVPCTTFIDDDQGE